MSQPYWKEIYCTNCKIKVRVWIPKGVTVEEYVKNNVCPRCKNKTLILQAMPGTWRETVY